MIVDGKNNQLVTEAEDIVKAIAERYLQIGCSVLTPNSERMKLIPELVKEFGVKRIPDWVKEGKRSPTGRHTFTTWRHWSKEDDLLPSGLIGPVLLRGGETAEVSMK